MSNTKTKNEKYDRNGLENVMKRRFFVVPSFLIYNGVAGLYDVENGVFYTSSSNTELIAGPEVIKNPIYDFELESIESTGTQYIDTGIIIDAPYEAEIVFGLPTG